jgi:hypothetical protein
MINSSASLLARRAFLVLALSALPFAAHATTYYVDSDKGDDANAGTSDATPWKSLGKVNHTTLAPGDQVLFARGGVWTGELEIKEAGADGNPIYFGAYGDAAQAKPTINGGGKVRQAIFVKNNANNVTVENFAVTNFDGHDIFDGAEATRAGIWVGEWGGHVAHVKILHNDIAKVESCSNHPKVGKPRGSSLPAADNSEYSCGALLVHPDNYDDVLLDGNSIHDCTGTGILAFAFKGSTGLLIQNNTINNIGSDGIEILNATAPVVQYNSCVGAGNNSGANPRQPGQLGSNGLAVAGMWATGASDILFQYNYCEGTHVIKYDGEAWDFDNRLTGTCVYQYNVSRDNEGGFCLGNNDPTPNYKKICRFNISINDGSKQGAGESFFNGTAEYDNNIFYRTDGKPFFLPDTKLSSKLGGVWQNNIFYTTVADDTPYAGGPLNRVFSNNCYFGFQPNKPGTSPVLSDPMFVDAATAITVHALKGLEGFQLQPGSPCLGTGVAIPDNGGKNFWGQPLAADKANIGAQ